MALAVRRPFSIGDVLGRAFPIWGRNIFQLSFLSAVIHSPLILHAVLLAPADGDRRAWAVFENIQNVGRMLLGFMATAALIHGVFQRLRGQPVGIGACLRVCLSRFLPVLGVSLLVFLIAAMAGVPIGILVVMRAGPAALILVGLASVVLLLTIYLMLWVAVPVAVVERPGIVASLKRSTALTRGSRLSIFVILLVVALVQGVAGVLMVMVVGAGTVGQVWAGLFAAIVLGALTAVANAVGYHDLRVAKEGVGIEDLVRVFE